MTQQPYRPPQSDLRRPPSPAGTTAITAGMIDSLSRTRPWVVFLGVLGMIFVGLIALVGFVAFFVPTLPGMGNELTSGVGVFVGVLYLAMAFLYFFPSLYLLRYGGAIKQMGHRANAAAMENALQQQASFWRFVGIFAAVITIVYAAFLIIGIGLGVVGSLAR